MAELRDYQAEAAGVLVAAIQKHGVAFDASDTGVGKTFTAFGVMDWLNPKGEILIVCPKSVVPAWMDVANAFGREVEAINYEKLKTGRTPWLKKKGRQFIWTMPPDSLVVFDEVHRCGGETSQNSKMLALTKGYKINVLGLSATIAETPLRLRAIGFLIGLHNYRLFRTWLFKIGCKLDPWLKPYLPKRLAKSVATMLHHTLFPDFGTRVRIADIPDFPENQVDTVLVHLGSAKEIDAAYAELAEAEQEPSANSLVAQTRARQKVELVKVPGLVELAKDAMAEGVSPVIFVSFRESARLIRDKIDGCAIVWGDQDETEREANIAQFQCNAAPAIVLTVSAGGVGVSLHDLHGRPRMSLICPSFSGTELKQALGRIHRAGSKSPAIQKILFAADTVEQKVRRKVQAKIEMLDTINDGDLIP